MLQIYDMLFVITKLFEAFLYLYKNSPHSAFTGSLASGHGSGKHRRGIGQNRDRTA
ncbi:hypothetical protein EZS27_012536 [termite gut metagenome]|uniref:Uncharacterized protein n=1 Tax=termite gut metagenome TaxID=433724 RepID=A0A5J4S2J7_9ZZZZ